MRNCPQPVIIGAIDGVWCRRGDDGAGLRPAPRNRRQNRVSCSPRRPGRRRHGLRAAAARDRPGRASELLFTGRAMTAEEGLAWASSMRCTTAGPAAEAQAMAAELAAGPTFAHGMTKTMLQQEWAMTIEQAIEAGAQAQAICMQTQDFTRAYEAFAARQKPVFAGRLRDDTDRAARPRRIWPFFDAAHRELPPLPAWRQAQRVDEPTTGRPAANGCAEGRWLAALLRAGAHGGALERNWTRARW